MDLHSLPTVSVLKISALGCVLVRRMQLKGGRQTTTSYQFFTKIKHAQNSSKLCM